MFGTTCEPVVSLEEPTSSTRCGRSYSRHPWIRMYSGANETQQDHPFGRSSLLCQTNQIGIRVSTMPSAYITTNFKRSQIIWVFTSRRSVSLRSVRPHEFENKAATLTPALTPAFQSRAVRNCGPQEPYPHRPHSTSSGASLSSCKYNGRPRSPGAFELPDPSAGLQDLTSPPGDHRRIAGVRLLDQREENAAWILR